MPEEVDFTEKTVPLQQEKVKGKTHKGKRILTPEQWELENARADPDYETSDSEAERAQQEALLEGKHIPCWRPG